MKVAAAFRGLDVKYDTNRALGLGFDLAFDGGAGKVDVTKFGFNAPGGGKFGLEAHLDTNRLALKAGLRFTDFQTASYVPPALRADGGGQAGGAHRRERRPAAKVGAPGPDRPAVHAAESERAAARGEDRRQRFDRARPHQDRRADGGGHGRDGDRARVGEPRAAAARSRAAGGGERPREAAGRDGAAAAGQERAARRQGGRHVRQPRADGRGEGRRRQRRQPQAARAGRAIRAGKRRRPPRQADRARCWAAASTGAAP